MRGIVLSCLAASCQASVLLSDPNLAASFSQSVGGILQAAQVGLSRAERHQEKAVQRARADTGRALMSEAQGMGELLATFSLTLQQANRDLLSAVNFSNAAIASADVATPPDQAHSWSGPLVEAKADAQSQVEQAATAARSNARHDKALLREAKSAAQMALEDHAEELSRRVGDMSSSVDAAKAKLESTMEAATESALPLNGTAVFHSTAKKEDVIARMAEVANFVKSAQASSQAKIAAAKDKVDVGVAKADKEIAMKVADMVMKLVGQEHTELQKLRGKLTATAISKLRGAKATMPKHREVHASKTITEKKLKAAP